MLSLRIALLAAAAALLPGCLAVAAGVGAAVAYGYVQFDENQAHRDYRADVDAAFDAAVSVLRQNGHRVAPDTRFADVGGRLDVDEIRLEVTANSSVSSRVTVRVGTFSNEAHRERAAAILDAIAIRLGE